MHLDLPTGGGCEVNYAIEDFETKYDQITRATTREPWDNPVPVIAPEDEMMPEPCSFGGLVNFMEMSVEEAQEEYLNNLEQRVHPEFAKQTKF